MSEPTKPEASYRSIETQSEHEAPLSPERSRVPGWVILAHPRSERVGERAPLPGLFEGMTEELSRVHPEFAAYGSPRTHPLADPYLSRRLIRLIGSAEGILLEVDRKARNAVQLDGEVLDGSRMLSMEKIRRGVVLLLGNRVALLLTLIDPVSSARTLDFGLVGNSSEMIALKRQIERLAKLDIPVLIRGETGTGKELVARALHNSSPRSGRAFVAVNLGAIPPTLAAAEFFGAVRGAFTGADKKRDGFFHQAEGGTLFLDEIGEAPGDVQALLLRALESGEVQPVGGGAIRRVDLRLVAATDTDLESAVESGQFRRPLLHRLAGLELRLAPLRSRLDDLGPLLRFFLLRELEDLGCPERLGPPYYDARPWLPASLVARLAQHPWPGNVRELRNVARSIAVTSYDLPEVEVEQILARLDAESQVADEQAEAPPKDPRQRKTYRHPDTLDEEEILNALREQGWRLKPAAAALNVSRTSLYAWVEKNPRIRKAADISQEEMVESLQRHGGDLVAVRDEFEVSDQGLKRRIKQLGLTNFPG